MPPIDLRKAMEEASRKTSEDQLWATRGKAVQAYARLEQALCRMFAGVSGTSQEIAAIIFFRIASASARNQILEKLIRLQHKDTYNLFWNSIFKAMPQIDGRRNEIIHWMVMSKMELPHDESPTGVLVMLRPPTYWSTLDDSAPQITNGDLLEFIRKCD